MTGGPEIPEAKEASGALGEDTVELELTAAEQLELSRASESRASEAATLTAVADKPGYDTFAYARTRRADVVGTITFAALVCGIAAAAGWHALLGAPAAQGASAPTTHPTAVTRAQPLRALVQLPNPFDPTEMFELPAETSEADARSAIAELLLRRARERQQQGFDLRRASTHHPHPAASAKPSDVFVTKLLAPASKLSDPPGSRNPTVD
jgi:hypothetical protein